MDELQQQRNCSSEDAEQMMEEHSTLAAVTRNARSPSMVRQEDGMTSVDVETLEKTPT